MVKEREKLNMKWRAVFFINKMGNTWNELYERYFAIEGREYQLKFQDSKSTGIL